MIDTKPNVEERYTAAGNTSDLTVDAERNGDGDLLIAAGWSPTRLGSALLRLHSEWDGSPKPTRPTQQAIEALALTMPRVLRGGLEVLDVFSAHGLAHQWYVHEYQILLGRLKTLPSVREQIRLQADKWHITEPHEIAALVIRYWLDQTCTKCHGRRWQSIPGAPSLSAKPCPACMASGVAQVPRGQEGRRLLNYMDDCLARAQQSIRNRLRPATS